MLAGTGSNSTAKTVAATKRAADLGVDGVLVVALLKELVDGKVKISLRANRDFEVDAIARSFGGGGHKKAAGATLDGPLHKAKLSLRNAILEAIDAELDAGLLSVEAAYLHVIGGVGERSTTQASLDAAREALQTRIEIERELRA